MDVVNLDKVQKQLKKVPEYIKFNLLAWAKSVEHDGIRKVRQLKSYHDEPLKRNRRGQRSIRLSKSYRAIYGEENDGTINLIIVEEVNKHEY